MFISEKGRKKIKEKAMNRITAVFFSPAHTSKKVVEAFCEGAGLPAVEFDLTLPEGREKEIEVAEDSLLVLCAPVYGGHTARVFMQKIRSLKGAGQRAVLISVYGNRHYDMALKDLYEAASGCGFRPVAWGRFIGEHSFNSRIQTGRPDVNDLERAKEFGRTVAAKADKADVLNENEVPGRDVDMATIGMHGVRLSRMTPGHPIPSAGCIGCGTCAAACPMGIINPLDSSDINGSCIKCNACVKACPVGAMAFPQEDFRIVREDCMEEFGNDIHVPVFFVNA